MKESEHINWLAYLDPKDEDINKRFLIDEDKKQLRFSSEVIENGKRKIYIQFNNGARTKWHFHTKSRVFNWENGEGLLEIRYEDDRIAERKLSEKRNRIVIPAYTIHRYGGVEGSSELVLKTENPGETIWVEDDRHYKSSTLATFSENNTTKSDEKWLKMYAEVNANYRHLADIRFKLLSLVPAVSLLLWLGLLKEFAAQNIMHNIAGIMISILALRVVHGLIVYDKRNNDLYNDLISRGRKIEEEIGVDTGIFKGRKKGTKVYSIFNEFKMVINHNTGLGLIYSSVTAGWYFMIGYFVFNILQQLFMIAQT